MTWTRVKSIEPRQPAVIMSAASVEESSDGSLGETSPTIQGLPTTPEDQGDDDSGRYRRRRLVRTCCMTLNYISMGLVSGIISTALPDLQKLQHCDATAISLAIMFKSIGVLSGSIGGALLADRHRKHADLGICVCDVMIGALNAALPWSPNLVLIGVYSFVQGVCHGTINVVCCAVTMAEWGETSSTPINLLHASFSLGLMLAPLTTAPFLSADKTSASPQIWVPFAFQGAVGVAAGLVFLSFYLSRWDYRSAQQQPDSATGTTTFWSRFTIRDRFTAGVTVALFLLYVAMNMRDKSLGTFNFSIATAPPLDLSNSRAAIYNTFCNASWTVSRLCGVVLSKLLRVHWIVFGGLLFTLADSIALAVYGLSSELFFWMFTCGICVFSGPFYPSVLAWSNEYIIASGAVVAVVDIGIGAGGFVSTFVGGYLFQHFGGRAVFYQILAGTVTTVLVACPLQVAFSVHGNRFRTARTVQVSAPTEDGVDERTPLIK